MAENQIKAKYKIGQKVWSIVNGYVSCESILCIFVDRHDSILYGFSRPQRDGDKYTIEDAKYDSVIEEGSVFPTKKALIKFIEDQEEYE